MRNSFKYLPAEWAIAFGLLKGKKHPFLSIMSVITIAGLSIGVMALMVVVSVSSGFESSIREKILSVYPHLAIVKRGVDFTEYRELIERLEKIQGIQGVSPATYDEMMIASEHSSYGAIVKGIDIASSHFLTLVRNLVSSSPLLSLKWHHEEEPPVFLGKVLYERLKVKDGDMVTLVTPLRGIGSGLAPFGMEPLHGNFKVAGSFETGFYDYDSRLVLLELEAAKKFLNRGDAIRWLEVITEDIFERGDYLVKVHSELEPYYLSDLIRSSVMLKNNLTDLLEGKVSQMEIEDLETLPSFLRFSARAVSFLKFRDLYPSETERYRIIDWREMNQNLFTALSLQKFILGLFFLIIVVVATFNIVGTQMIVIRQKAKEIAIMRAMGARRRFIRKVFIAHGVIVGGMGVTAGSALGLALVYAIKEFNYPLDPKVYLISALPAEISPLEFVVIVVFGFLFTFLSTLYSAVKASRLAIVDGLQNR